MATVDVPAIGPIDRRVVIGVGVAVVGATGYVYWRRSQAPVGDVPAVEAFDESELVDVGEYGGGPVPQWRYTPGPTGDVSDGLAAPRTNAEWGQRAQEALSGAGFNTTTASVALGKYLAHQQLNADEANMVRAAIGLVGNPPNGAFSVTLVPAPSTPAPPALPAAPKGMQVSNVGVQSARVTWSAVPGAIGYGVYRNGAIWTTTLNPWMNISGLKPRTANVVEVAALNSAKKYGPKARITFRTK